ncbi:adaptor protein MecA [Bacillus sp. FJAT-49736]|uniref:adaptor protein MecA n=1 Tax=Bacillus sp. FJAT-49736 TaxID=2833582 RepID=UPI001BCA3D93|nr:adaptor protein MecA [Bacillus sp. FJAT-49736]MBS4173303.1 adaptor protein MecA [Bacillus sp. FJAT-49736]
MKLERLSQNKIKYSISFEELVKKGFLEEGLESFIWHDLFDEMVEIAKEEYHFEISDSISIEIFSLNPKEIVLILTIDEISEEVTKDDNFGYNKINGKIIYCFESIEDVILLSLSVHNLQVMVDSKLLQFENQYYLIVDSENPKSIPVLYEEYGTVPNLSLEFLEEYGTPIIEKNALEVITDYFSK